MSTLTSSLHFLSGVALFLGVQPDLKRREVAGRKSRRRLRRGENSVKPLTDRQKKELLDSIRQDDWHE